MDESAVERLRRVAGTGESPDGSVRVTLSGQGAPKVEFAPGALRQHNDRSLGIAVASALTEAISDRQRTVEAVLEAVRDGPPRPDVPGTRVMQRRELFDGAVGAIAVSAISPRGQVTVSLRAGGEIDVQVRQGTLALVGVGEAGLAAEVAAATSAALHERNTRILQIHKDVYRTGR